ncbi:hypothetical protein BGZ93_007427 [Podila epicladia]|nr:hypothetical protein BGZ93_007427 [Podila epicladia]
MKLPPFSSPSSGLFLLGLIGHLVAVNGQSPSVSPTDIVSTPLPSTHPLGPGPGETPVLTAPQPLGGMAYSLDKRILYIQGGNQSDNTASREFYKLDLSVRWHVSSPAWTKLPNNSNMNVSGVSGGFLSSGAFVVHSKNPPGLFSYDISTAIWTSLTGNFGVANGGPQVATATDNRTYFFSDGFIVDPQSTPQAISPAQTLSPGLAVAWSLEQKKVVTVVTTKSKVLDARTLDLMATTKTWNSLPKQATGILPSERTSHCLVPVESRPNTFLLYGGKNSTSSIDELWSLNIDTAQWVKLSSSGEGRHSMACAVSGETLVVWGGFNGADLVGPNPLLYDLATDKWDALEFVPTPTFIDYPPISQVPSKTSDSGPNVAAIAGGVAGGVVLIALIGFFLYRRRAHGRGNKNAGLSRSAMASKNDSGHSAEKEEFIEEARERSLPNLPPAQLQHQQQQIFVLPRGDSPTAAPMTYPAVVPMQQPPLPMQSRPLSSPYTSSVNSGYSGPVPVIRSPFEDVNETTAKHPLLTPVPYTPATQHQPRPQDSEVMDLMPITRSEAGSLHSRTNSVSSRHSLGRRTTVRTAGGRTEGEEEEEDEEEELDYL